MTTFALVGAGPGLGLAAARRFGAAGHRVALVSRNIHHQDDLVAELARENVHARGFTADVLDADSLTAALNEVADTLGPVEILQFSPVPRGDFMKPVLETTAADLMDIRVTLDGRPVDATLNDSPPARDFAELLPLTLDLEDFHGIERVADLPRRLDTDGAPEPAAAKIGDIAYYAPWGNLALFYQDGPAPSADLLVLGHLDVSADRLGSATRITIEAAP
ncbi:cyclophilin-like fold protein [Streptomyces sp. NPDC051740]|uniref:cyclophilin-like fold protein n=1 Tax=Streptomyces sp. NPDC051740 TaxID=3365673 RepID=UPI0037A451BE